MTRSPLRRMFSRLTAVLLGAALSALLAGCQAELFGKLSEADANAVLDALYSEGISATKLAGEGALWRIEVDADKHQQALHIARQQGLPRERFASMGELFKKEGLVSTPSEERLRYIFAVSQELSNTLSQIDGVLAARVHPVIPFNDPLSDKVRPASAAVFIKHSPEADLQQLGPAIKTLVTRSIEGLSVENVSLTFFASRAVSRASGAPLPQASTATPVTALAVLLAAALAFALVALGVQWKRRAGNAKAMVGATGVAERVPQRGLQ